MLHNNYGYYVNKNFEIKTIATNTLIESDDPVPSSNR